MNNINHFHIVYRGTYSGTEFDTSDATNTPISIHSIPIGILVLASLVLVELLEPLPPSSDVLPPCGLVLMEGFPNPVEPGWRDIVAGADVAVAVAETTVLPSG